MTPRVSHCILITATLNIHPGRGKQSGKGDLRGYRNLVRRDFSGLAIPRSLLRPDSVAVQTITRDYQPTLSLHRT
jgi:hypothetical protein